MGLFFEIGIVCLFEAWLQGQDVTFLGSLGVCVCESNHTLLIKCLTASVVPLTPSPEVGALFAMGTKLESDMRLRTIVLTFVPCSPGSVLISMAVVFLIIIMFVQAWRVCQGMSTVSLCTISLGPRKGGGGQRPQGSCQWRLEALVLYVLTDKNVYISSRES